MSRLILFAAAIALGLIGLAQNAAGFITLRITRSGGEVKSAPAEPAEKTPSRMLKADRETFDLRWASAPPDIRALARKIAEGGLPDAETLALIGPEALARGYREPALDFGVDGQPVRYFSSLLKEAALAYNLEATRALLANGADPNVGNGHALFIAIRQRTIAAPMFMLFPDFDDSLPIVQALLDAGADPNMRQYGFRHITALDMADKEANLGAVIALVDAGADPWLRPTFIDDFETDSVIESMARGVGNAADAEVLFRLLRASKLPPGPDKEVASVLEHLDKAVEMFAMGSDAKSRHTAWRLDQVLPLLGKALDREAETNRIRAKLTDFSYQDDGGWYLAADEIHSRYNEPLMVPDRGDHVWGP